jgi:hypothetical protein
MSKNKNLNETYKEMILEKEDDNSDMKNLIML